MYIINLAAYFDYYRKVQNILLITFDCDFGLGEFTTRIVGCLAQIISCIRFGCLVYLQGGCAIHKYHLGASRGCDLPSVLHPLNLHWGRPADMAAKV